MKTETTTTAIDWSATHPQRPLEDEQNPAFDYSIGRPNFDAPVLFSLFENCQSKNKTSDYSIDDYIEAIKTKNPIIDLIRSGNSETERKTLKKENVSKIKAITAHFVAKDKGRKGEDFLRLNGLICIDIDKLPTGFSNYEELKNTLVDDDYIYLIHYSVSGNLCAFIKIENHHTTKANFEALQEYFGEKYSIELDSACTDNNRLRFVSYDEEPYSNQNSKTFIFEKKEVVPVVLNSVSKVATKKKGSKEDQRADHPANVFNSRPIEALEVIKEELEALGYKTTIQGNETHFQRPNGSEKSIVAHINRGALLLKIFSSNTVLGSFESANAYQALKEITKKADSDLLSYLSNLGFGIYKENEVKGQDSKVDIFQNLENFLLFERPRLNLLNGQIETFYGVINDYHFSNYRINSSKAIGQKVAVNDLEDVFNRMAYNNQYHPFKDYINDLEDETPSLDEFQKLVSCFECTEDQSVKEIYFKRWILGLFDMNYHHTMTKNVLMLSGVQNAGKTSVGSNILPPELKSYVKKEILSRTKITDSKIALCANLVTVFDECESIFKSSDSMSLFKDITATYDIKERRPHARFAEQMYRQSLIMGTTNDDTYLNDYSGNTRFLTLGLLSTDFDKLKTVDFRKAYKYLYYLHKAGETSNLTEDERALQSNLNKSREVEDELLEFINLYFEPCDTTLLIATQIQHELKIITNNKYDNREIGKRLKALDVKKKISNMGPKYYIRLKHS
jgi:hypothetical protein